MSEPTPTLAAALVEALRDLAVVEKARTAKIEKKAGGHYSYDYADIADVVKLTRPKLAEHGIVALTPIHDHGNGLACTVVLLHASGERLDLGPFPFPDGRDAQTTGSMVTYHRRYALVAALGIAAGDDDDGAAATAHQRAEQEPISDEQRQELHAAIDGLDDDAKARLRDEWKARRVRKLEELTVADLDAVHDLIADVEAADPEPETAA